MDMKKGTYKKAMYYNGTTEVRKKMTHLNITLLAKKLWVVPFFGCVFM